ncbi:hypothetical protein DBY21_09740 [Candidatus Gastranaerophilales bacterium]|nr:MAG: hypothetical protein DBY21_09740 [Candidatus Gastranaerophilales bacterium]
MSIYMPINQVNIPKGTTIQVGKIAKQTVNQLQFNRAMENVLGHTNKDYFNLTHASKPENSIAKPLITFAEGFKNFFERGTMF